MEPYDVGTRHWSRELPSVLMEELRAAVPSPEDPQEQQVGKTIRLLMSLMPGARSSRGSLGALMGEGPTNVIKGPWKPGPSSATPRLDKDLGAEIIDLPTARMKKLLQGPTENNWVEVVPKRNMLGETGYTTNLWEPTKPGEPLGGLYKQGLQMYPTEKAARQAGNAELLKLLLKHLSKPL